MGKVVGTILKVVGIVALTAVTVGVSFAIAAGGLSALSAGLTTLSTVP